MTEEEAINAITIMKTYHTETNMLEAKTASTGFSKKWYDTFSSFSNKYGGIIIFGLNEENGFCEENVYDINDLQKQLTALCSDCMEPCIRPDFLPIIYNGKKSGLIHDLVNVMSQ
jgi:ATP-dependent DNA helicase RecG